MNQKLITTLLKYKKIILVGWGTGWHIQPIVSLVKHIRNTHGIIDFTWIWWIDSQEEKTAKNDNIQFQSIPTLKLSTTKSFKILLYPSVLIQWILEARKKLKNLEKENNNIAVFSKWWPGSVAIGIAAWSLSIPLFIHESDTIPWRSNILLEKIATKVFLGFESAKQYFDAKKCEVVGQILDPIFSVQPTKLPTYQATMAWNTNKPHILVICGSQGAKTVFEAIIQQFSRNTDYEWIIALGKLNSEMKQDFDTIPNTQVLEWIEQTDIAHLIQDTDLAITRWSATTLAELTSFQNSESTINNPQLIIIPLTLAARNHQFYNAKEYEKIGHTILKQKDIKELKNTVRTLLKIRSSHGTKKE